MDDDQFERMKKAFLQAKRIVGAGKYQWGKPDQHLEVIDCGEHIEIHADGRMVAAMSYDTYRQLVEDTHE